MSLECQCSLLTVYGGVVVILTILIVLTPECALISSYLYSNQSLHLVTLQGPQSLHTKSTHRLDGVFSCMCHLV